MRDWITFPDGRRGRLQWANDPDRARDWQRLLADAHGLTSARPRCDCLAQGQTLSLSIREMNRSLNGRPARHYVLARMPYDGPRHAPSCPFHQADPIRSGRRGYTDDVICELRDGRLRIRLAGGLTQRAPAVPARPDTPINAARSGSSHRQAQMSLLGLMQLLWEQARLNDFAPSDLGRRNWWPSVRAALQDAAASVMVGREPLDRHLVPIGFRDELGPRLLADVMDAIGSDQRILLIGLVDHLSIHEQDPDKTGNPILRLIFDGGKAFNLYVRGAAILGRQIETSFPWAWRELQRPRRERGVRVVGLVLATIRRGKTDSSRLFARAESIALMEVGPALIPVASSYELAVLHALIDAGRQFRKPLRFDSDRDLVLPDFELLDTADPRGTPMEVFGRTDEAYLARLAEKRAYYDATYGAAQWWSWDATTVAVWPRFPPPVIGREE